MEQKTINQTLPLLSLQELKQIPVWVCWRAVRKGNRKTKVPVSPLGGGIGSDPQHRHTWTNFDTALAASAQKGLDGVGFIIPEGFAFLDLDGITPEDPLAQTLMRLLPCYTERSVSGTGKQGNTYHYYKCVSVKKKLAACSCRTFRKQWLEDLVVNSMMDVVQDGRRLEAIVSTVMALQDRENTALPMYEQQLQGVNLSISNLLNAIQQGLLTPSTKSRLEQLEASREDLEHRIALEKLAKPKVPKDFVEYWLRRFRMLDVSKEEHRKQLIETFLNAVYVYDDKLLILCNYKEGTKTVSFSEIESAHSQRASLSAKSSNSEFSSAPKESDFR